jgi:hypothetical protein
VPPAELPCRFSSTTVRASDIALFNFYEHFPLWSAPANHVADARDLDAATMIKLKDDCILLAAIDAWVIMQVSEDEGMAVRTGFEPVALRSTGGRSDRLS